MLVGILREEDGALPVIERARVGSAMTVGTTERMDPPVPKLRWVLLVAVVVGVALGVFSLLADGVFGARVLKVLGMPRSRTRA